MEEFSTWCGGEWWREGRDASESKSEITTRWAFIVIHLHETRGTTVAEMATEGSTFMLNCTCLTGTFRKIL